VFVELTLTTRGMDKNSVVQVFRRPSFFISDKWIWLFSKSDKNLMLFWVVCCFGSPTKVGAL